MTISRATRYPQRLLLGLAALFAFTGFAHAATPDCSATSTTLNCRLQGVLSFLYVAAAVLGVALVVVLVLSIRYYRNNRRGPGGGQ